MVVVVVHYGGCWTGPGMASAFISTQRIGQGRRMTHEANPLATMGARKSQSSDACYLEPRGITSKHVRRRTKTIHRPLYAEVLVLVQRPRPIARSPRLRFPVTRCITHAGGTSPVPRRTPGTHGAVIAKLVQLNKQRKQLRTGMGQ